MQNYTSGYGSGVTLPTTTESVAVADSILDSALLATTDSSYFTGATAIADLHHSNVLKIVHFQDLQELTGNVQLAKRVFDIIFSICVMAFGFPVIVFLYLMTKFSSAGPAIFMQERIGKNGRPFYIYKFRSMHVNAEKFGPQLSKESDPRITKWGRLMRMTRLDELPQFWNVLKGDMSVVGPRPERQFYIDKIVARDPHYLLLQRIKPGITSIGQVEFGYAEDLDEMCKRLQYDLMYLKNMSLRTDLSIVLRTVNVMLSKSGK